MAAVGFDQSNLPFDALERARRQLQLALADATRLEIGDVAVADVEPIEILEARRIADPLGDEEPLAALEAFDVLHRGDVRGGRRIDPTAPKIATSRL